MSPKDQDSLIFLTGSYGCVNNCQPMRLSRSGGCNFSTAYFKRRDVCLLPYPLLPTGRNTGMRGESEPFGTTRTQATFHRCQNARGKPGLKDSVLHVSLRQIFFSPSLSPQDLQVTERSHHISLGPLMPGLSLEREMHIYLIDITTVQDFAMASESAS